MVLNLFIGFFLAWGIALSARYVGALSRSGARAATGLGTIVFGLGGLIWALMLLVFFVSSSVLSRLFRQRKQPLEENYAKGSERDAWQVLANGAMAGLFCVAHAFYPMQAWPWIGFAAALAAANADTWATELGTLSAYPPRLISNGQRVEPGTSGGITLAGVLAALAGAGVVSLVGVIFWRGATGLSLVGVPFNLAELLGVSPVNFSLEHRAIWLVVLTLAGLVGSLVDSLLGATLQAVYRCPVCAKETERHPRHSCGTQTVRVRGLPWLNNDLVNLACTLSAALTALGTWLVLH